MNPKRALLPLLRLSAVALLLQSVGCAPKIYTSIHKSCPARPADANVLVYYITDTLPERAEVLGKVEVRDNGMSTKCSYPEVLQRAKEEANKAGGNGLVLTWHKEPTAFGSSCHQIAGDILLMPDSVYKESCQRNTAMQVYRAHYFGIPTNTVITNRIPAEFDRKPCVLMLNAGYGFVTSKYYIPEGTTGNPKQGLELNGVFQWTGRSGIGFGLRYAGYFSSYKYESVNSSVRLHYIAPEFVTRCSLDRQDKWIFHVSAGIGYTRYSEKFTGVAISCGGFGYHADLGFEYKIAPSIGLGLGVGCYSTRFSTMDYLTEEYAPDDKAGITHISMNGGVRFYF